MPAKFGRYQVAIGKVQSNYPVEISENEVAILHKSIDRLAEILSGTSEWVLSGGLSIPLSFGINFYRRHRDVDLGLPRKALPALVKEAQQFGYELFSRIAMTKISPSKKIDLYKQVSAREAVESYKSTSPEDIDKGMKNIRLVMTDMKGKIINSGDILDYFDIYMHEILNGQMVSLEERMLLSEHLSHGKPYATFSGRLIMLRGLAYMKRIKQRGEEPIDRFDLEIIKRRQFQ